MEMISVILLTVVLLAQIVLYILFFLEKRRSNRRHDDMLNYIDWVVKRKISGCKDELNEQFEKKIKSLQEETQLKLDVLNVDYSQAQEAANKINDFGVSLANIFDYDPIKAVQRGRNKEAG